MAYRLELSLDRLRCRNYWKVGASFVRGSILAGFVLVVMLLSNAIVRADGGPHGGYDIQTNACAGCHRAHTAVGPDLLKRHSVEALCQACHLNNSGANGDVWNGRWNATTWRLNGGGLWYIRGVSVTSAHRTGTGSTRTAWGGATDGLGATGVLECTSCHNPHGSTNYRILRDSSNGEPEQPEDFWQHRWDFAAGNTISDTKALDWADHQVAKSDVIYLGGSPTEYATLNRANYTQGMNTFCATCHKSYLTASGSARTPSTSTAVNSEGMPIYAYPGTQAVTMAGPSIPRYRHAIDVVYADSTKFGIRLSAPGDDPFSASRTGVVCTTCHFAHGSTAEYAGYASNVAPTNDSALLYYPNRGVCNACHQKNKTATSVW